MVFHDVTERRRAEELMLVSEVRYRRLFEESDDGILLLDPASRKITSANPFMAELLGYPREELVGKELWQIGLLKDESKSQIAFRELQDKGRIRYENLPLQNKSGERLEVEFVGNIYQEDGQKVIQCNIRDITARKQASQYARSLLEASLDPLVTISAEGKITDVNEGSIKVTGVAREKLIGTDFSDYFTEPEQARQGYQQVFAKGFVTDYPLTIRHKDGRLTDVLYNASIYKDVSGNVLGVFAAARDVTERKVVEEALRENEVETKRARDYAEATLRTAPIPLIVLHADLRVNTAAGNRFDLVISDLRLLEGSGTESMQKLRGTYGLRTSRYTAMAPKKISCALASPVSSLTWSSRVPSQNFATPLPHFRQPRICPFLLASFPIGRIGLIPPTEKKS